MPDGATGDTLEEAQVRRDAYSADVPAPDVPLPSCTSQIVGRVFGDTCPTYRDQIFSEDQSIRAGVRPRPDPAFIMPLSTAMTPVEVALRQRHPSLPPLPLISSRTIPTADPVRLLGVVSNAEMDVPGLGHVIVLLTGLHQVIGGETIYYSGKLVFYQGRDPDIHPLLFRYDSFRYNGGIVGAVAAQLWDQNRTLTNVFSIRIDQCTTGHVGIASFTDNPLAMRLWSPSTGGFDISTINSTTQTDVRPQANFGNEPGRIWNAHFGSPTATGESYLYSLVPGCASR